jgi:hypothetical protein
MLNMLVIYFGKTVRLLQRFRIQLRIYTILIFFVDILVYIVIILFVTIIQIMFIIFVLIVEYQISGK